MGAKISKVYKGGIAYSLGIGIWDEILSINDKPLKDIFDYKFLIQDDYIRLKINHRGDIREYEIEKLPEEDLGVEFEDVIFDGIKRCQNSCIFCFIDQLPKGLRNSLYIKDDDYRLSFLYGNYITLTNIKEEDLEKIINYRLSPLYVSVHSTIDKVRLGLIRNKRALGIFEKLSYLVENGILLNIQIVLIPTINDKDVLRKTLWDLYKLRKGILSVAIVPVGLTRYREHLYPLRKFEKDEILDLISEIEGFQKRFRNEIGKGFVYLADEFYLSANLPIPDAGYYDEFTQVEDGVGMARLFIDDIKKYLRKKGVCRSLKKRIGLVTGVLGEKALFYILPDIRQYYPDIEFSIIKVKNEFFGEDITVTGLLTAQDIESEIERNKDDFDKVLVPNIVLNEEEKFLDDVHKEEFIRIFRGFVDIVDISPDFLETIKCKN